MKQTNNNANLIGAMLIGAAVGGALGIIFAPDKGSETRKKILAKGEDLTDAMKEKFQDLLDEVKKELEMVKEKAHVFMGDEIAKAEKFEID